MNNLKKLDQSVFDGLPPEYKFADVDANGRVFVYDYRPCVKCFDGKLHLIPGEFDATDWQNSLIVREEEARSDMLQALGSFEHSKPQNINWVKCSDRMPEHYKLVLLWQGSHIYLGFLSLENGWVIPIGYTLNLDRVSHWCEIEGPKE